MTSTKLEKLNLNPKQEQLKKKFIDNYVKTENPIDTAGLFSRIFFMWANPILTISQKVPYCESMIYSIQKKRSSEVEIVKFKANFNKCYDKVRKEVEQTKFNDESEKPNV